MSKPNKIILIIFLAIFAVAGGFFGARALVNKTPRQSQEQGNTTPVENPVENSTTQTTSNQIKPDQSDSDNKTPAQYEGSNPNDREELTGYFSVKRLDNDRLTLRINIDQYLSSGTCTLTITDAVGNHLVENSVEIIPDASTSTCAGFDLANSNFSTAVKPLQIQLTLTSDNKQGTLEAALD